MNGTDGQFIPPSLHPSIPSQPAPRAPILHCILQAVLKPTSGDTMATKLDKTIKREIELDGQPYMVAISPDGVKLTQKGFRKGREMTWKSLWEGGSEEGSGGGA